MMWIPIGVFQIDSSDEGRRCEDEEIPQALHRGGAIPGESSAMNRRSLASPDRQEHPPA
jgi:hypothetical protein